MAADKYLRRPDSKSLTRREIEVAELRAVHGLTTDAIAERLCVMPSTVRQHLIHIHEKTGVHSQWALLRWLLVSRLISVDDLQRQQQQSRSGGRPERLNSLNPACS